ncbi:MAG: IPT/TIG domain-containing protein, partial [Ktedonobacterales bacterium]
YVYLPNGDSLNDGGSNGCSASGGGGYCAYNNWTGSVEYGAMPYPGSGCQVSTSPNNNVNADSEVNLTSHEQAESITDPYPPGNGWVDSAGYEIGDKCAWDFSFGLTHTNNGGTFEVQTEYSNATSSCVNSYGTVSNPPSVTSFSPTSGTVGTSVAITGSNFTGATAVKFNGTSASFSVGSSTSITATVPTGATTGKISVTTGNGTGTSSSSFTVTTGGGNAPTISSFSPTSGAAGTSVTITGTNFTGATAVKFNGTSASFSVGSSTSITATVPSGATTGPISVTTANGTGTSASSFTVSGGGNTTQLLANPGFESGQTPWSESSANGYQIVDPTNPHTGSYSAYLCGYDYCNDQIWQTVTLPSTTSKVVLSYWLYIDTSEASGSPCYDYFHAKIRTSSGGTITTVQTKCNSNANNGWVQYTFDLTSATNSYHGKQIEVYFQGTTDVSLPTDFFVDDVALNVTH